MKKRSKFLSVKGGKSRLKRCTRKISAKIKKHKKLYSFARCLISWYTDSFYKLIFGYYAESGDFASFMIERMGDRYPDKLVYYIPIELGTQSNNTRSKVGFFGRFHWILQGLNVAEYLGAVPVVEIGINSAYYDPKMDHVTKNVFEYYFEPVSNIKYTDINLCKNVFIFREGQARFFMKHASSWSDSYKIGQDEIEQLAKIYKKYIRLNSETDRKINKSISECLKGKKTLGIHIRGSDFNVGYAGHPNVINVKEYMEIANQTFNFGEYDQIFIATDDANSIEVFRNAFGDRLIYYDKTFRSSDSVGVHVKCNERPYHHYKLGLEVLRDVYTLASCESLICGLSQVAFAARYVKLSKDETFKELKIVDHGVKDD